VKRASYKRAIHWLAFNGTADDATADDIRQDIGVALVADLFALDCERVAADVLRVRTSHARSDCPYIERCSGCRPAAQPGRTS
jgi:hypothetical protein